MSNVNLYACRDAMWLDQQGGHYVRHVDHMTREGLHSKSDIAAELGWRDYQIAELTRQVSALQTSQDNIINGLGIKGDGPVSKLVLEYVLGLVAENEFIRGEHEDYLGPYACVDLPATKVAIAEIKAQGVDELSSLCFISYNHQHPATEEFLGFCKQFAADLRAGRKG